MDGVHVSGIVLHHFQWERHLMAATAFGEGWLPRSIGNPITSGADSAEIAAASAKAAPATPAGSATKAGSRSHNKAKKRTGVKPSAFGWLHFQRNAIPPMPSTASWL